MDQLPLTLPIGPPARRRGRPPGARNKRSADLARYVEAVFGGMTPGQVSAELALVRPGDMKRAKAMAKVLQIPDLDLSPLMLAMAIKARQLASALGCEPKEAWLLMAKERADLLPYIHQRRAQAADEKDQARSIVYVVPEGEAQQLGQLEAHPELDPIDLIEDFRPDAGQVGQPKSDEPT